MDRSKITEMNAPPANPTLMFTGQEVVATLVELGVTHVIWIPDSATGLWEADLEAAPSLELLRVCREGEAWPLAAGLALGGKKPFVVMQTTGLFESGDALRNIVFDLQIPVFGLIGVRNWLYPDSPDTARRFTQPIMDAWQLGAVWIESPDDKPRLLEHVKKAMATDQPGIVLMAEGKG